MSQDFGSRAGAYTGMALRQAVPVARMRQLMRTVLALLLIYGMAPALGEVVESAVHVAVEGHLAHTDADHGDLGEQGCEHGCGTTEHHCGCCASQVVVAPPSGETIPVTTVAAGPVSSGRSVASLDEPAPPLRPPIAS